jgi:uncharacterized protein YndB with AHSA1/START domain
MTAMLKVTRTFRASAERVFDAWLDEKTAGRWWFATPAGKMVRCEIVGRVGGKFMIAEQRGEVLAEHFGTFVELARPTRIVFDFATDAKEPPTRVTVAIAHRAGGGCDVTLSHTMSPEWEAYKDRAIQGWTMILESLGKTID